MPRTKVAKSSKRNREADNREEKLRDFETTLEGYLNTLDTTGNKYITEVEGSLRMLTQRTSSQLLQMKMGDFLKMNLSKFCDWRQPEANIETVKTSLSCSSQSICNLTSASQLRSNKISNPYDEGYLTEDSAHSLAAAGSLLVPIPSASHLRQPQQQGRTPGPLNSARARRPRRSRSACGDYIVVGALKPKPSANMRGTPLASCSSTSAMEHASRNRMRTPMAAQRTKAFSADRAIKIPDGGFQSPPSAFMRWPKPGEVVLSTCGSPVVAQIMPDTFANVNIPMKNGVISLRPKKLSDLNPDFINSIEPGMLSQIKTLHANLDLIMNMADKAGLK